jgi:hypothetical protein
MDEIIKMAILDYLNALKKLKTLKIINNKRDFTSQLGEWLIAELYSGKIASNGKQKDWDLQINDKFIQVKSHSKATTTKRRETDFVYNDNAKVDFFIIIIFDENYKLENIYKIPWQEACRIKSKTKNPVIRWKDVHNDYRIDFEKEFPNNKLLSTFLEIH